MNLTPRQIVTGTETYKNCTEFQKEIYARASMISRLWDNFLKAKSLGDITLVNSYADMGSKEIEIINELLLTHEN